MLEQNVNPGIPSHRSVVTAPQFVRKRTVSDDHDEDISQLEGKAWLVLIEICRNGRVDGGSGTRARPDPEAAAIGKFKPRSARMSHLYSNECQIP
jgi:hypothetical protein